LTRLLDGWPLPRLATGAGSPATMTALTKLWDRCTGKDEAPALMASRMTTTYRVELVAVGVPLWAMYEVAAVTRGVYETLVDFLSNDAGRSMLQAPATDVDSIVAAWKTVTA